MRLARPFLFGILVVGILGLLALNYYSNKKTDWTVRFQWEEDIPHNFSHFQKIIASNKQQAALVEVEKDLEKTLDSISGGNHVYIKLGFSDNFSKSEVESLKAFLNQGNTAFIATPSPPSLLLQHLYLPADSLYILDQLLLHENAFYILDSLSPYSATEFEKDSISDWYIEKVHQALMKDFNHTKTLHAEKVALQLKTGEKLMLYQKDNFGISEHYWNYYYDTATSRILEQANILGTMQQDFPFFIEIPVGEGTLQMMMEPLIFTNYHIQRPDGFTFVSAISNAWGIGKKSRIIIDKINRSNYQKQRPTFSGSPLSFILSKRSLRWAWYLALFAVFTYLLSNLRRRQREIPVLPKVKNTTLEFSKVLGTLDQSSLSPAEEALEIMKLFKADVLEKLRITHSVDEEHFWETLAALRPACKPLLAKAFEQYKQALNQPKSFRKSDLVSFYNIIQQLEKKL